MEQAARLFDPKQANKEGNIADAIELWEEKVNRLARYGEDYQLNEAFKNAALNKVLVDKVLDNFDMWQMAKLPFEELPKMAKEHSRLLKLDTDGSCGMAGVAVGADQLLGENANQKPP